MQPKTDLKPSLPPVSIERSRRSRKEILRELRALDAARDAKLRTPAKAAQPGSTAVKVWNRLAFGPRPGDLASFWPLGSNGTQRIGAWLDQQLDPASIDDSALDARLAAANFTTLNKSLGQLWTDHHLGDPTWSVRIRPATEVQRATLTRRVHSNRQLLEVMSGFWHDHFSVYAWMSRVSSTFVSYDRDVIRANALGNFRTMLEAVARSTAMLVFLDNWISTDGGPNENYARELFELHGLGAENYLGILFQNQVPTDGQSVPVGYVDADVYESTRAFTGWTVDEATGAFFYEAADHDRFQKTVLGVFMPPDQPAEQDGLDVLDAIASHPGTARFICRKLCRRLVADDPPQSLVDSAAQVFIDQSAAADQIAQVVRHIALSDAFRDTFGERVRRPVEHVVAFMRAANATVTLHPDDPFTDSFMWLLGHSGHELFSWPSPEGPPDRAEHWLTSNSMVTTIRLLNWLADRVEGVDHVLPVVADHPPSAISTNQIVDTWIGRMFDRELDPVDRQILVEFMAQGRDPDIPLNPATNTDTQERLRSLVGLLGASPTFFEI